jgi:hypothetical protein
VALDAPPLGLDQHVAPQRRHLPIGGELGAPVVGGGGIGEDRDDAARRGAPAGAVAPVGRRAASAHVRGEEPALGDEVGMFRD